jgi:hypothetical protein
MITVAFFEFGSNRPLGALPLEYPPVKDDIIVIPGQGDRDWQVDIRRFKPRGGAVSFRREEVEVWVSLVS